MLSANDGSYGGCRCFPTSVEMGELSPVVNTFATDYSHNAYPKGKGQIN